MTLAVRLIAPNADDPLRGIEIADRPRTAAPAGWTRVRMRAASVNASDFALMRGHGVRPDRLPTVLGSDGAGVDEDGNEVIVYPILADPSRGGGDPMLDPRLRMLSQGVDGTFAEEVWLPRANLVPKPPGLSWETAACLGTAWLTAYRMLFGRARVRPGETILVRGAGGGVSSALVMLARAAGVRVWVSTRDPARGARAVSELGADAAFPSGGELPGPVDAVMDPVGAVTFRHSVHALRPGGRLVVVGAVGGSTTEVNLTDLFVRSIQVIGSAMGSQLELARLAALCASAGIAVPVDSTWRLDDARQAFAASASGRAFGKIVLRCG